MFVYFFCWSFLSLFYYSLYIFLGRGESSNADRKCFDRTVSATGVQCEQLILFLPRCEVGLSFPCFPDFQLCLAITIWG